MMIQIKTIFKYFTMFDAFTNIVIEYYYDVHVIYTNNVETYVKQTIKKEGLYHFLFWLLFGLYLAMAANIVHKQSFLENVFNLVIAAFIEPFSWIFFHVQLHIMMFQSRQIIDDDDTIIFFPKAFTHHYQMPTLYSKIHWGYMRTLYFHSILQVSYGYMCGLPRGSLVYFYFISLIDYWGHSWYHTPKHLYNSMNPFSHRFILINYFYNYLNTLGICDKAGHYRKHHNHTEHQIEKSENFIDLHLPISSFLAENTANFIWQSFLYFNKNITNTDGRSNASLKNISSMRNIILESLFFKYFLLLIIPCIFYSSISFMLLHFSNLMNIYGLEKLSS